MTKTKPSGLLLPFVFDNIPIRGKLLQLNDLSVHIPSLEVGSNQGHSKVATFLAEMLSTSIALAADLKNNADVTLQIHSESSIPLMVTQCKNGNELKAFANIDKNVSDITFKDISSKKGTMVLTVEQQEQQYQSILALNNSSISSSIEEYFEKSAQSKTYFRVFTETKNNKVTCGAIMLQIMGESSKNIKSHLSEDDIKDNWHRLNLILNTIKTQEIVPGKYLPEDILMRLFAEDTIRVFEKSSLKFAVADTRKKMELALKSLGVKSCKELIKEAPITMTCKFSGKEITFSEKDLKAIFADDWDN